MDGEFYEIDQGQRVAYIVHQTRSQTELAQLDLISTAGKLPVVVVVYKMTPPSFEWRFLGGSSIGPKARRDQYRSHPRDAGGSIR